MIVENILSKIREGRATESEIETLRYWLQSISVDEFNNLLILDEVLNAGENYKIHPDEDLLNSIHFQILEEEEGQRFTPVISIGYLVKKLATATAVIILGSLLFWIYKKPPFEKEITVVSPTVIESITPGKYGAILQLGSGNQILLDTLPNGNMKNTFTQIIKTGTTIKYTQDAPGVVCTSNTLITPRGRAFSIEFADGSKAWLNASSSIKFPTSFEKMKRQVEISGEVYFEVAKIPGKPFIVNVAGKTEIEVLGTHFNINSYLDEPTISTTLLEGSVKITEPVSKKNIILKPGEQVQIFSDGQLLQHKHVDVEKAVSWKHGIFEFDSLDISVVSRQLSRWYNVDIIVEGKSKGKLFGGAINKNTSFEAILNMLRHSGLKCALHNNRLVIQQ